MNWLYFSIGILLFFLPTILVYLLFTFFPKFGIFGLLLAPLFILFPILSMLIIAGSFDSYISRGIFILSLSIFYILLAPKMCGMDGLFKGSSTIAILFFKLPVCNSSIIIDMIWPVLILVGIVYTGYGFYKGNSVTNTATTNESPTTTLNTTAQGGSRRSRK